MRAMLMPRRSLARLALSVAVACLLVPLAARAEDSAVAGGTVGAIAGAQAAARPGYYLAQGNCYYRYPSGQYVQVDPRTCY